ncbi:hypothetical protein GCM10023115_03770 [Pontixanthobacter gangjinensis]|uniref:Uncharacterized protein n=1 Tax=Pontixanthobacter gangjinensis TaxID=1028742 RepID=A0A6I4SKG9_9SPHN|nr:hypothetical protein [Pontixanthobacter gangjinensis]MXO55630.1 hypothetical protein [Pontixanthobacter gangjinensis]
MSSQKVFRLAAAIVIGLTLATLLLLQSFSSVLMRKNPALAVQLLPVNGLAQEQLAARQFMGGVKEASDITPSARTAASMATAAFGNDPLSPKAHAILALAENDAAKRQGILEAATRLNRRDLLLQGLVLEGQVERRDYSGTLETLDAIMRVHPEQKANFFPILTRALEDDSALSALSGILDRKAEWQEEFLKYAASQPDALANLAELRLLRGAVDPEVDARLIRGLVAAGSIETAYRIFEKANGVAQQERSTSQWHRTFAPFDWRLEDQAAFRAQPDPNSNALEIFVRSGKGGVLAERWLQNPNAPLTVTLAHSIEPAAQIKDVRMQFSCATSAEPYYERALRIRTDSFDVPSPPAACKFVKIAIYARSWSGSSDIRGTIDRLDIKTPQPTR